MRSSPVRPPSDVPTAWIAGVQAGERDGVVSALYAAVAMAGGSGGEDALRRLLEPADVVAAPPRPARARVRR